VRSLAHVRSLLAESEQGLHDYCTAIYQLRAKASHTAELSQTVVLYGFEVLCPTKLLAARSRLNLYGIDLFADKLESLLAQQQSQIHQLSSSQISSGPSPQDGAAFRSPPVQPHVPRPETALFLQKPHTFPSQSAIQSQFASSVTDRPTTSVTGNGYGHGQNEELQRDSFAQYNEQYAPAMSRTLGQADADFPPYDLLYGLVDLFFKHIYPWVSLRATMVAVRLQK
jgi:hypothetical protein